MSAWRVPRIWPGETCYIVGGGPSLKGFNFESLRNNRVIVINRMFRYATWADVLYFTDRVWWRSKDGDLARRDFAGLLVTCNQLIDDERVNHVKNTGLYGLELDPGGVRHGTNSGYTAINLAFHFGVSRIVLLGFDMQVEGEATHAHEGYGVRPAVVEHILGERMLPMFQYLVAPLQAAGVQVVNASPKSLLNHWPKVPLASLPLHNRETPGSRV